MDKIKAIAVIGANYGDEGKGATTHYLTKTRNAPVVIRFNGGNQAGHTVQLTGGKKHVFSSFCSGTLARASSYISEHALFNPKAAYEEYKALTSLTSRPPALFIDPNTQVISPWDIALNQFIEHGRGPARHGSCGLGIGEAMLRITTPEAPKLQAKYLPSPNEIFNFCIDARAWFKKRLKEEAEKGSFSYLTPDQKQAMKNLVAYPTLLTVDTYQYATIMEHFFVRSVYPTLNAANTVIFEGAQGLLLDEDDPNHQPHVTWSKTGITNVVQECEKYNLDLAEVYYVTRPYLTRHGSGPILVGKETTNRWGVDLTNKPNDYQGVLRYAYMDWKKLKERIDSDTHRFNHFKPQVKVVMTCMDQIDAEATFPFKVGEAEFDIPTEIFLQKVESTLGRDVIAVNGLQG